MRVNVAIINISLFSKGRQANYSIFYYNERPMVTFTHKKKNGNHKQCKLHFIEKATKAMHEVLRRE